MSDPARVFADPVITGAVPDRLTDHAHQILQPRESVRNMLGRAAVNSRLDTDADPVQLTLN